MRIVSIQRGLTRPSFKYISSGLVGNVVQTVIRYPMGSFLIPIYSLVFRYQSTEIELSWGRPQINGSPIIEYNIELNDSLSTAPGTCLQHT